MLVKGAPDCLRRQVNVYDYAEKKTDPFFMRKGLIKFRNPTMQISRITEYIIL